MVVLPVDPGVDAGVEKNWDFLCKTGCLVVQCGLTLVSVGVTSTSNWHIKLARSLGRALWFWNKLPKSWPEVGLNNWNGKMKIKNSLKSLKGRHRANRIVRRRGRVYVINKENPRFKARQG